jgi:hypothetical protein
MHHGHAWQGALVWELPTVQAFVHYPLAADMPRKPTIAFSPVARV